MAVGCRSSHSCLTSCLVAMQYVSPWCAIHLKDRTGSGGMAVMRILHWSTRLSSTHSPCIFCSRIHLPGRHEIRWGNLRLEKLNRSKIDDPSGSLFLDLQCISVCSIIVYRCRWWLGFWPAAAAKFQNAQMLQWRWHGDYCLLPKAQWASELWNSLG